MFDRLLFNISAAFEQLTGVAVLALPALIVGLLFGDGIGAVGIEVARVLGVALCALGFAAWESDGQLSRAGSRIGLCVYNSSVGSLLVYLGFVIGFDGLLLWPAAIFHVIVGVVMITLILRQRQDTG
jgi:hypothetical protein